jgi:voltage-gated sodium channel
MSTEVTVQKPGLRERLRRFFESDGWEKFITTLIIINAITLGLETSEVAMAQFGGILHVVDRMVLSVFVVEIASRIVAFGRQFWRDPWSLFDFFVVSIALVPASGDLSVLRALRILRALRLISIVPSMRRVVSGLLSALPGMGSIMTLLLLLLYVFSVMATNLYGARFPEMFGTIGTSAFTLFQVMTLEGWAGDVVRPIMQVYPFAWAFFVVFILATSFAVLNLFIGIIVDAMQSVQEHERQEERAFEETEFEAVLSEIRQLRQEVRQYQEQNSGGRAGGE